MSSFPRCEVCNQQFLLKGPAPFLLPCLHAVCEKCVTSAAGGVISCSPCQRDVNLTEMSLQKDSVREKEILHLTVQHHPDLVLCTHEDDGNQAVCWCKECEDFLCENCQMVHNSFKATRRHAALDIGDLGPGSMEEDLYCKIHPKNILDAWDEDCCILTCGNCRLEDHAQHKAAKIEHAAEIARREVANLQKDAQSAVDKHGAKIEATQKNLLFSDEKFAMIPQTISHTLNSLKTVIDQREKELQVELEQYKDKFREDLAKKIKTSKTGHQRCHTITDYIKKALKYSSDHDIMSLRHVLQSKTEDCQRSVQANVDESSPFPILKTDGLEKIKSALFGFCTIASTNEQASDKNVKDNGLNAEESLSRVCEDSEKRLEQLKNQDLMENVTQEKLEERYGLYRLKEKVDDGAFLLYCPRVEFSTTKYNANCVHVNAEGELINEPQQNDPYSDHRLENYEGTSSTAPLKPSVSTQYFEVKSKVMLEGMLDDDHLLLEIGLSSKEGQDNSYCLDGEHLSYSLAVKHCTVHSSICRSTWKLDKRLRCLSDTLENAQADLHYGVVYNSARSRVAFLDVGNKRILSRVRNIDSSITLWPMFGVFNDYHFSVSMSLVVGGDIDMTEWKKALILKSLSF